MFPYLIWLKEVDSTQRRLKESSLPYGTVFVADVQKEGKGRKGRRWESQAGGLYISFVLWEGNFKHHVQIPLVVGLAVAKCIEDLGFSPSIKWPNDVYVAGRKLSGVLVEKSRERIVVGVGINVNQESFPGELGDKATSLYILTKKYYDRREVLLAFLKHAENLLEKYAREGFPPFLKEIKDRLMFLGCHVIVSSEKPITGVLEGIDREGFLLLRTSQGMERVIAGDVSLRPYLR
ncbi:MAG TPA: biotin--[acetyl-CoA-carboxylase] ligase [Aquifex aeolicus]|nr:biotin--[acetyl-CoA-carboxylase] ligase [Aquifex aeolicus]